MKKFYIILIAVFLGNGAMAQTSQPGPDFKSYNPLDFQEYLAAWASTNHAPGMSVTILRNGEVYWKHHLGFANIAENKPVTDSTAFLLCSISKLVNQTAAMQLYEQGEFGLYDDINGYLPFEVFNPNFPDSVITFFQLMTHTSSILDTWGILDACNTWGEDSSIPLGDFLEGYLVPGGTYYNTNNWYSYLGEWAYSNVGNALLGYLVEVISGQDFDAYCREHILDPLGVGNASFFLSNMDTTLLATPYSWSGTSFVSHLQLSVPYYPAATLKMSALDLSKFLCMYMNHGTYNGNTILNPETIELITTPFISMTGGQQCLSWCYEETYGTTYWGGSWHIPPIVKNGIQYSKKDQWGVIYLINTEAPHNELWTSLNHFAMQYDAFSVETISMTDTDGDRLIEPNEEFSLGLKILNNMNVTGYADNVSATISVNSPFVSLTGDSTVTLGTLNYLDEIQLPADQFNFTVANNLVRGNIGFQLHFTWDDGKEYTTTFSLFGGLADVLLVRDEASFYQTQEWYMKPLDSLGYVYQYHDLAMMGDPVPEMINNFPAVIWFTGYDADNTISENNQLLLEGYLDNGGNLFMSGQNISDELAGTAFLENYLHIEHLEDSIGSNLILGIADDPIGNGQPYQVNMPGDALLNQYSKSVVGPIAGANMVFRYIASGTKGAAIRFENNIYKTVFFAFGFEAINGFDNRTEILFRILNDYFQVIVGNEDDQLISQTSGIRLHVYPNPLGANASIDYTLPQNSMVTLKIFDASGREMATLVNQVQAQGEHKVIYSTAGLKSGVYFCTIKSIEGMQTRKLIKVK